jgi:DNA primase small subunit
LFPNLDENGWRGRFAKEVFGSKSRRPKIISQLIKSGHSSFLKTLDDVSEKIGVKIDPSVTMDIHRIFRLPGSINSKSGLSKILCRDLQKFDPYLESCILDDDSIEITANCPIEFKLKNKKFGPYDNETVTVPTYAAAYMICKNLATIT